VDGATADDVTLNEDGEATIEQSQLDQSVERFEGITGTDVPGEAAVLPDIDPQEAVTNTVTGTEVGSAAIDIGNEIGTDGAAAASVGIGGQEIARSDAVQNTVDDVQDAIDTASSAALGIGGQQIAQSETVQSSIDEVEDAVPTQDQAIDTASSAALGIGGQRVAQSETVQDTIGTVEDAVPSQETATDALASASLGIGGQELARTGAVEDLSSEIGNAVPSQQQAGQLARAGTLGFGGQAVVDSGIIADTQQAIDSRSIEGGNVAFTEPLVQAEAAVTDQSPGEARTDLSETISELNGADSEDEAIQEVEDSRENAGPVTAGLAQTGEDIEVGLAQFSSDLPDSEVRENVQESRQQEAIEAAQQGPATGVGPAVGASPAGAARAVTTVRSIGQSSRAVRAGGAIASIAGGGIALEEVTAPENRDDSELQPADPTQDVQEVDVVEPDQSELDVGTTTQDLTEVRIPEEQQQTEITVPEQSEDAFDITAQADVGVGQQQDETLISPEEPTIDPEDVEQSEVDSDDGFAERSFPTGESAVVGNTTPNTEVSEEAGGQQEVTPADGTTTAPGTGDGPMTGPGAEAGPDAGPGVGDGVGTGEGVGVGAEAPATAEPAVGAEVGVGQSPGFGSPTGTGVGEAVVDGTVESPANADGLAFENQFARGRGRGRRPRRPRRPELRTEAQPRSQPSQTGDSFTRTFSVDVASPEDILDANFGGSTTEPVQDFTDSDSSDDDEDPFAVDFTGDDSGPTDMSDEIDIDDFGSFELDI